MFNDVVSFPWHHSKTGSSILDYFVAPISRGYSFLSNYQLLREYTLYRRKRPYEFIHEKMGPMKGSLSVGRRLEICVGLRWSVKCRATNSECRCRATLRPWMTGRGGRMMTKMATLSELKPSIGRFHTAK